VACELLASDVVQVYDAFFNYTGTDSKDSQPDEEND